MTLSKLLPIALARPRMVLVLYCLALWLPGILGVPATDRDESRFAQATKQMLETGDFIDIRNGTEARNRKPIGIYWLQAPFVAVVQAMGGALENPIWPYRLPSLAGALIAVLATFSLGRRLAGPQAGLWAGAMLGGCVLLTTEATIAKTDAALLGATTVAMGVLARAWLQERPRAGSVALFWLAMGVGIQLKGPIAPMIVALTAATLAIWERRVAWLSALRPSWGVPLMLAVVLPWFVAIGLATHGQFFRDAVGGDLAAKLAGGDDAHGAPPGMHLLLLPLTLFPSGGVALCALPSAWRGRRERGTRFLLAWLIPTWIVFEAVPTKLPHYTLPLFPALCLLAAGWIASPVRQMPPRLWTVVSVGLSVVAAIVLGAGAAALPAVVSPHDIPALAWGAAAVPSAALLAWRTLRNTGRTRDAAIALGLAPLLYWSILGVELPHLPGLWAATEIRRALAAETSPYRLAAIGYAEPSLMFLNGTRTEILNSPEAGARFLGGEGRRILLVEQRSKAGFLAAAPAMGEAPKPLAQISGFNYSNGRHVTVTLYETDGAAAAQPIPSRN